MKCLTGAAVYIDIKMKKRDLFILHYTCCLRKKAFIKFKEPGKRRSETIFYLGKLVSDEIKFDLENGNIIIPTDIHAKLRIDDEYTKDDWVLGTGNIELKGDVFENSYSEFLKKRSPEILEKDFESTLEIHLGQEVENFFNEGEYWVSLFSKALESLGKN